MYNQDIERQARVIVKFQDYIEIPYEDGIENYIQRSQIGPWDQLSQVFPGITFKRLFTLLDQEEIKALVNQAAELNPEYQPPNLLTYFMIDCPPNIDSQSLVEVLSSWQNVQTTYRESGVTPPPQTINPYNDPLFKDQGYLKKAPEGIDAEYAWKFPGGGGKGIEFVDIEHGWNLNHEDLIDANIPLIYGFNKSDFSHGTAVLGIVVGVDNSKGGIGIAPHASAKVVSESTLTVKKVPKEGKLIHPDNPLADIYNWTYKFVIETRRANAILYAIKILNKVKATKEYFKSKVPGNVLLLEMQTYSMYPAETEPAIFDLIKLATSLGIVVIEPAGNNGKYLDSAFPTLNRNSNKFKDSGAIMVGAATSTYLPETDSIAHYPLNTTNYGSRLDCYAWGEDVYTCSTDDLEGTASTYQYFGGTSSAAAIIAGTALVIQGIFQENFGRFFSPLELRDILSSKKFGTPADVKPNAIADPLIGVMPNLRAIIEYINETYLPCKPLPEDFPLPDLPEDFPPFPPNPI